MNYQDYAQLSVRAIFFTKDRPMQFRAMLESFLYNVDVAPKISVIMPYRMEYKDILEEFDWIDWIFEEEGFGQALTESIMVREDHIFFGVDDQLIVGSLDLTEGDTLLSENEDVLCYSYRLGKNIKGYENIVSVRTTDKSIIYTWREHESHWGYSFSLDTTMYRKKDCITSLNSGYVVPADFEATALIRKNSGLKNLMAFPDKNGVGICQDVNKVQTAHGAPEFGDPVFHNSEYLINRYLEGDRLDWMSAQGYAGEDCFTRQAVWKINVK